MENSNKPNYPAPVGEMVEALYMLKSIKDVTVGLKSVEGIKVEDLSLHSVYAQLPHLALRRSGGGIDHEALVTFQFDMTRDKYGWIDMEFLNWYIRDLNRGGEEIQFRAIAYPPSMGEEIQLGNSMTFLIEIFYVESSDDFMKIAEYVGGIGKDLKREIDFYKEAIDFAYKN